MRLFGRAGCFGCGVNERRLARRDPLPPFWQRWPAPAVPSNLHCGRLLRMARRRDALDLELAAFEKRLPENPAGCDGRYPQPC